MTGYEYPARRRLSVPRTSDQTRRPRQSGRTASLRPSLRSLRQSEITKYLDPPVVGIHHEDAIVTIDEQSGRQLEFPNPRASSAEIIKQASLPVENLDHAPEA